MPTKPVPETAPLTDEELAYLAAQEAAAVPPPPQYAPVEPGMYAPVYGTPQPAYPETLPPIPPVAQGAPVSGPPPVEPGMYEPPYGGPGQYDVARPPLEPGIYEPTYTRPGEYAPLESASAYYGGPVWPPYHNGAFNPARQWGGAPQPGVAMSTVSHPASGAPTDHRLLPSGGTVVQPGTTPDLSVDNTPDPRMHSTADILGAMGGGTAPPHPVASVGPTGPELGYRVLQGDPGVVNLSSGPNHYPRPALRSQLPPAIVDLLAGLFGGGQRKSSQVMPQPPRKR